MKTKYIRTFLLLAVLAGLIAGPVHAKNDKNKQLPPGLQKKAERGQPLPPGWQKKLAKGEIMSREVYSHAKIVIPIDSHGMITVNIEGKVVRLYQATREIIEILK